MAGEPQWKKLERQAAALFGAKRAWANSGESLDFESSRYVGQVKLRRTMSLEELTVLSEQVERDAGPHRVGVVVVKRRRGPGRESPILVVVTAAMWKRLNGRPEEEPR